MSKFDDLFLKIPDLKKIEIEYGDVTFYFNDGGKLTPYSIREFEPNSFTRRILEAAFFYDDPIATASFNVEEHRYDKD